MMSIPVVVFRYKIVYKLLLSEYWILIFLFVKHLRTINCLLGTIILC